MENDNLNYEKIRAKLREVETDIKIIVGLKKGDYIEIPKNADCENVKQLLRLRCFCLDMLFRKDPEGIVRFRKVNELLRELSDQMYRKGARIYRQYLESDVDGFDDDFIVEGSLRFVYNGGKSVLHLGDEGYYGSDFLYMMNVIHDLFIDEPFLADSFVKNYCSSDSPKFSDMDLELSNSNDDYDWGELKIWIPELAGIKICKAVNEICVCNKYSVADLLRMNDFWCEVKAVYQKICDQNGN